MIYSRFHHLAIERAQSPPTEDRIAAIETLLGASLPTSFRAFLQVANGGYLEYIIDVPFGDGKSEMFSFCELFSAKDGAFCDGTFVGEILSEREYKAIPLGVLPFARDGGGSMVYIDLSEEGQGRVVAYIIGLPEWTGLRTQSNFIELASSFYEYVSMLRIDREDVIDHMTHDITDVSGIDATQEWLNIGLPLWREDAELMNVICQARLRVTNLG